LVMSKKILEHRFTFGGHGGEELSLKTIYFANGDIGGVYTNQEVSLQSYSEVSLQSYSEVSLQSYSNSAHFKLCGTTLDPTTLRKLADELEKQELEARNLVSKRNDIDSVENLVFCCQSFEPGEIVENQEAFAEIVAGYLNLGGSKEELRKRLDRRFSIRQETLSKIDREIDEWACGLSLPEPSAQSPIVEIVLDLAYKLVKV